MRQLGFSMMILAAAAGTASAAGPTVDAQFLGIAPGVPFRWSVAGSGFPGNPNLAGCFNWTRTGGTYPLAQGNFTTFCMELTQDIQEPNIYSYKVVPPATAPGANPPFQQPLGALGADRMSELFGRWYNTLNLTSANDCAAFQLAVWGVVYDANLILNDPGDMSFGLIYRDAAGNFPGGGADPAFTAAFNQAQSYLTSIDGTGPHAILDAFANQDFQDQIYPVFIPAPGAMGLLCLGGLAAARRRR